MIWIARHAPRRNSARLHRIQLADWPSLSCRVSIKIIILTNRAEYLAAAEAAVSSPIEIRAPARMTVSRGPRSETDSTRSPANTRKPAMIIVRVVTSDGPDGQPWPPPDSNTLWAAVRRAGGCTVWRAIHLAEVQSAGPDFCISQTQQMQGSRHDTR
jgi:hypothetical protein